MSEFTGERLHAEAELFRVDLARHEAAYHFVADLAPVRETLDVGCGTGYGTRALAHAATAGRVFGVDRVAPDSAQRDGAAHFARADVNALPYADGSFQRIISFQVIEHLEDPSDYLAGIARLLAPDGEAWISTPNRRTSDGVNPYHVREYVGDELAELLGRHFGEVSLSGVGMSDPVRAYFGARQERVARLLRLDPLGLHRRMPRALVDWGFPRLARLVRWRAQQQEGLPDVDWRDYPVGPADDGCLDLLARCSAPIRR